MCAVRFARQANKLTRTDPQAPGRPSPRHKRRRPSVVPTRPRVEFAPMILSPSIFHFTSVNNREFQTPFPNAVGTGTNIVLCDTDRRHVSPFLGRELTAINPTTGMNLSKIKKKTFPTNAVRSLTSLLLAPCARPHPRFHEKCVPN